MEEEIIKDSTNNSEVTENTEINNQANEKIELKKELDETTDRLKRVLAEFDNYKKRSSKEREMLYANILSDIVKSLLPVVDNLEMAVESDTKDENYKQGVGLVLKQFKDVLTANGVQEIQSTGQSFNPEYHEAVSTVVDSTLGEKIIKEEYRKGYKIGEKVVRHSMVVVAN